MYKDELRKLKKSLVAIGMAASLGLTGGCSTKKEETKVESAKEMVNEEVSTQEIEELSSIYVDKENPEIKPLGISRQEAKILFDQNKIEISKKYNLEYEGYFDNLELAPFPTPKFEVRDVTLNGKSYLVNADDIYDVYFADYQSHGGIYYDDVRGLYYCVVLKDDKDYFINVDNFNIIKITDEMTYKNNKPSNLTISRQEAKKLFANSTINETVAPHILDEKIQPHLWVKTIEVNGNYYIVDADDIYKVYVANVDKFYGNGINDDYYDEYLDLHYYDIDVINNNKVTSYMVNAKDFSPLLINASESCDTIYYLKNYDYKNGGKDDNTKYSGYVRIIKGNDLNYLVDAEDYSKILAVGDIGRGVKDQGSSIVIKDDEGNVIKTINKNDFVPVTSDILKRTIKTITKKDLESLNSNQLTR